MAFFSDEEYGTRNASDVNYQKKIDSAFRLFAQGALSINCVHSNISNELVRCEICNESNISLIFVLKNRGGNTIKCGIRCASLQRAVNIDGFREWKKHLEEQIEKEKKRLEELRSSRRTIVRKKQDRE